MKNKILSLILAAVLTLPCVPVLAYELPSSFWPANSSYDSARNTKNHSEIIKYGTQIIDLISDEPENEQTINIIASRAYDVAFSYYYLKDYDNAVKYFKLYLPYGEQLGWNDGVKIAKDYIKQLPSTLEIYKHTPNEQKYFGAKNEPHGVLFGQVSERAVNGDSMVLLYLEYGLVNEFNWAKTVLKAARENGRAVELALNFPQQGDTARSISASDSYLSELYNMLSQYTDIPIFLRIAAEVNIWGNYCTPDEYKNAFNIIASRMKQLPNIAIVWSIAHTDRWQSTEWPYCADDFYPGDEIVDWVGATVYCNKYFEAKHWGNDDFNEVCFKTGYSSDPVLMLKDTVEKYGSRKPITVSECGSAYHTQGEITDEHHEWASEQLKKIYSYIPMVYPQVKLMAYFNKKIDNEYNWYDLESSAQLSEAYYTMVKSPWFIKSHYSNKAESFFEPVYDRISTDGTFTVSAYAHLFGTDTVTVDYYLDGQHIKSLNEAPYAVEIPLKSGNHKLKVTASGSNGAVTEREYTVNNHAVPEASEDFADIDGKSEAIDAVLEKGIMTGYEDGTFRPFNTITRAEFSTMICRMMGYSSTEKCTFDDAKNHWATSYIKACTEAGAINGVGNNNFAPDANITIEQALKIVTVVKGMADKNTVYPDGFITAAIENKLTDGLSVMNYKSDLIRLDAAKIIAQAIK